jgi:hypothetical protein
VVRSGLAARRIVKVKDTVKMKHHQRTNDEVELAADVLKVVVLCTGGWLTAKPVAEDPD